MQEEGLARAVLADDEADRGATVGDAVDVPDQGLDFLLSADLDVLEADPGNDARPERGDNRVAISRLEARRWLGVHAASPNSLSGINESSTWIGSSPDISRSSNRS
jgi:hypothetical protein